VFIALHSRQSVIKAHVLLAIQYASSLQVGAFWSVIWPVIADVAAAAARLANTPPAVAFLGGVRLLRLRWRTGYLARACRGVIYGKTSEMIDLHEGL
jgi:hypothetical protein